MFSKSDLLKNLVLVQHSQNSKYKILSDFLRWLQYFLEMSRKLKIKGTVFNLLNLYRFAIHSVQ